MRARPIVVECQLNSLNIEALDWLAEQTTDLAWPQRNWRIWESVAEDYELTAMEKLEQKIFRVKDTPWKRPIRKRSVDAVSFASNADAVYFKLRFL